eukprot:CAMPEP_0113480032 /NCGR_PEP_ID=MMETSP0014_2-20120614/21641_1 /TAXON_ID=2857 /ORGANISM="Nitzschia sp." /LENGTH=476 /DNA_ID=CAMNT_0000373399 /DNA_START=77 /DNA_END=1503 /DNA_ORIENTATION=- /assembly_acc=CAM_ASM_000159
MDKRGRSSWSASSSSSTLLLAMMLMAMTFHHACDAFVPSSSSSSSNLLLKQQRQRQQPPRQHQLRRISSSLRPSPGAAAAATAAATGLYMVMSNGEPMPLPAGSLVALVTPMKGNGEVDIEKLRQLLRWHKEEGTDGIVILGTTGEASTLSAEEKGEIMAVTREEVGGVLPIVVGTGTIDTKSTIAATKQAKSFGADAALVVTPYYVKPSQAGLYEHFKSIADAAQIPIVLYNVPGRTGVDLTVETTIKLSHHPMIQGLKDATGDNTRVKPMRSVIGDSFKLYSGEDSAACDYVLQGGDGVISVTANIAPGAVSRVMAAANAGDENTAKTTDAPLSGLHRDLFCEANPIPVKWGLARIGKTESGIRLPLVQLGDAFHTRVDSALVQAGCLAAEDSSVGSAEGGSALSATWPSRSLLLQGHLFDSGLINQALEIIEKRGGDFVVESFYVQPNDQMSREFNWRSKSSVTLKVFGVDNG